jgi:hypothetical protein
VLVAVTFREPNTPFNGGETASFPPELAAHFVKCGKAVYAPVPRAAVAPAPEPPTPPAPEPEPKPAEVKKVERRRRRRRKV